MIALLTPLLALAFEAPSTRAGGSGGNVEAFLRTHLQFTDRDLARLRAQEPVGKYLPSPVRGELVLAGAIRLPVTRHGYLGWYRNAANWTLTVDAERPSILAAHILGPRPTLEGFQGLTLEPSDRDALTHACEPGDCAIKADAGFIAALRSLPPDEALRRSWHATAAEYLERGPSALPRSVDRRGDPVCLARERAELLRASPYFWVISPNLAAALERPPARAGTEHFFFWTKERYGFGLRTTAALYHALLDHSTPGLTVIATTQLRATHYFEGSLALTLLADLEGGESGALMVYINRARVDTLRGGLGSRLRPLIARVAPRATRRELRGLRERLVHFAETQHQPAAYHQVVLPPAGTHVVARTRRDEVPHVETRPDPPPKR